MDIKYFGHSSFFIKGKKANLVTDPYDSEFVGIKYPKHIESDIVTASHDHADHNQTMLIEGNPFIVKGPGEYEIKGVNIIGFGSYHDDKSGADRGKNTIFRIIVDDINIVHLGDLGQVISSEVADELDGVDILMIPVGGIFTLNSKQAITVINEIGPSVVMPMHYKTVEHNPKNFAQLNDLDTFIKEYGQEKVIVQGKYSVSKEKLPEDTQVIVFE